MRHLENAFKFTFKNFLLALPLLISLAIPALISSVGSVGVVANSGQFLKNFQGIMEDIQYGSGGLDYIDMFNKLGLDFGTLIAASAFASFISLVLTIIVKPATYGLINLHFETGNAKLNDFSKGISKYIGRFILFGLLNIAFAIGIGLVSVILVIIAGVVAGAVSPVLGILLMFLFFVAIVIGCVVLFNYLALWFPAICIEDSDVITGLKNSFKQVNGSFWPILGVTIMVTLGGSFVSLILGAIIGIIPVIGSVVSPLITGLAQFILIVYYFEVYREKTGRYTLPEPPQQFNDYQQGGVQ